MATTEGTEVARTAHVTFVDDLDGSQASETVYFSLGRRYYEIDLSAENARTLRDVLAPFVAAARRSDGDRRPRRTRAGDSPPPASTGRTDLAKIRGWASQNGHKIADRGPVPGSVLEAYRNEVG